MKENRKETTRDTNSSEALGEGNSPICYINDEALVNEEVFANGNTPVNENTLLNENTLVKRNTLVNENAFLNEDKYTAADGFVTPPDHLHFRAKKLFGSGGEIEGGAIAYLQPGGGGPVQPHTHPHDHLFIVVSGEARVMLGEEIKTIRPNEAFRVKGSIPHSVWNAAPEVTVMIGITLKAE